MGPSKLANAAFNFKPFHGPGMEKHILHVKYNAVGREYRREEEGRSWDQTAVVSAAGALNLLGPVFQAGVLVPEGYGVFHLLGAEVLLTELGGLLWGVLAAAEHVEEGTVGVLGEMAGDHGGLDQLAQGISLHLGDGAEPDHDGISEPVHLDVIAKVDSELGDDLLAPDLFRVALLQVYRGSQSPLVLLHVLHHRFLIAQKLARHGTLLILKINP